MDPCERLRNYIANFKESLKTLKVVDSEAEKLLDNAVRYYQDSRYYLEKGDCITGLVAISYAEGILDSLRELGLVEFSWVKAKEVRVLAAGSFDIIHPGHVEFLRWASSLGDKLYVVVSRDSSYKRLRGYEPIFSDVDRAFVVNSIRYVYKASIGSEEDFLKPVEEIKPDLIALGPDQIDVEFLEKLLRERGLNAKVVKLSSRVYGYSSSSIKEKVCRVWCKNI
ncbi:cytidylyltransferase family protein [Ignisphaera sp. 4213-co]|uniref:Cytidylyltransferase family protein n=1 Tax=Ignisphaera cupida TaxID=3050454 RepID=A0ABD4Z3D5_9CREN|nr:cytidylyltransferase family protein [Ignisphaera sp. 4213-co]MDK6027821.1 cytidylyltransferase family protein [Ignisphaera sp. 4213-co]